MWWRDKVRARLDKIDDRMMQCHWVEDAYQHGINVGRLHEKQMQRWYREDCIGPEPQVQHKHMTEYYVMRYLRKQYYKIVKEANKQ